MELNKSKTGRKVGYARVSRREQNEARQCLRLREYCDIVHVEKISGAAKSRPVFDTMIAAMRAGDTLVLLDFDRGFRSSIDALKTMEALKTRGINIHILNMSLDFSTEIGEVVFSIMAALAQFERRTISRRTKEGLRAAKARGIRLGRPRKARLC